MIKLALRIETAKATMPAKSIKSVRICVNQCLKMQKTAKKYKKSYVFDPKSGPKTSTTVEVSLQISPCFLQNKPNFLRFSSENEDLAKKQTQYKANSKPKQTQFWPKNQGGKPNSNPIESNNQLKGQTQPRVIHLSAGSVHDLQVFGEHLVLLSKEISNTCIRIKQWYIVYLRVLYCQRVLMRRNKEKVSRELGLEIGSVCGRYFLKLNHLHYGYWTDGLEVDIANVHIAQENYTDFLISHIPADAKKVLDVGCGTGRIAKKLIAKDHIVDCVSPSHFLAEQARQLLGQSCSIFECMYENLETENKYDVILFCESFQYIDIVQGLRKTVDLLNPDGYMLICDLFRKKTLEKSDISGGHQLELFQTIVSEYPFTLIKDLDITEKTAPTIDVINDMFQKAVRPTVILTQQFVKYRYPVMSKFVKWMYRKKIDKINKKYFTGEKTGEKFKKFKSYRLMLYKKSDSE